MNKKIVFVILLVLVAAVVAAPHLRAKPVKRDLAGTVLKFHTWDTYVAPTVFKAFEDETGIKVEASVFENNDGLLKDLEAGNSYDLMTPSGNYLWQLAEQNLLSPLPEELRDLGDHLSEPVKHPSYDPKYKWGLPVFYGTTGIAVNTEKTAENVTSWKQLFERPAGEEPMVGMLDEVASVITAASFAVGARDCDTSPDTLARIKALLEAQAPFVKTYSSESYYDRLAAGEVGIQMAWSGDVYIARNKNKAVKYVYPAEGVDLWMDELVIPANAKNKEAAVRFIEFIHDPKHMAEYAQVTGSIPAVEDAMQYLPEEMREAPEFRIPRGVKALATQACSPAKADAYAAIVEPLLTK